ncbi:MAG: threonine aldolase family protein [Fusobacteriaceae bacterium]
MKKHFASDNYSGVHPKIMEALANANVGHEFAYGEDPYTKESQEAFKKIFGDAEVFFVYNGTGSNVMALEASKGKATSVICADSAHIFTDEAGAPAKITGMQLLTVPNINGKIDLEGAKKYLTYKGTYHKSSPEMISISQTTEFGTIYSIEELKAVAKFAKDNSMYFHMDGARISNAAVALGCTLKEMTGDLGVDVLSFGGTKNGLMFGEAIVFFNKELAKDFARLRKQNMQLHSKMRFISSQYTEYLNSNLWYTNAKNANDTAKYFAEQLEEIEITVTNDVKGNTIFAILPKEIIQEMQEFCYFYVWDEEKSEVRFVTSFDTTKEDVDKFIKKLKSLI